MACSIGLCLIVYINAPWLESHCTLLTANDTTHSTRSTADVIRCKNVIGDSAENDLRRNAVKTSAG